jgi:hypothetical protein
MRRYRTALTGSACVLLLSCSIPTDTCACPPARAHAVIYGSVHSPAGQPNAGAQVQATVFRAVCGEGTGESDPTGNPVATEAAGGYRLRFYSMLGPQAVCVRVTARSTSAADSAVVHVALALRNEWVAPDSIRVDFVLP